MDNIKYIDNLPVDRWEEYKDLYTGAVKSEPFAFSETYEEILKNKEEEWKEELQKALDGKSIMVFAEQGGKLVGMGSAHVHKREKLKHNAFLNNLFVLKEFRGKGIGRGLVEKRMELILQNPNVRNIHCEIIQTQTASIELHKKLGFEITGELKDLFFVDGEYISEYWLEKIIK